MRKIRNKLILMGILISSSVFSQQQNTIPQPSVINSTSDIILRGQIDLSNLSKKTNTNTSTPATTNTTTNTASSKTTPTQSSVSSSSSQSSVSSSSYSPYTPQNPTPYYQYYNVIGTDGWHYACDNTKCYVVANTINGNIPSANQIKERENAIISGMVFASGTSWHERLDTKIGNVIIPMNISKNYITNMKVLTNNYYNIIGSDGWHYACNTSTSQCYVVSGYPQPTAIEIQNARTRILSGQVKAIRTYNGPIDPFAVALTPLYLNIQNMPK